MLKGIISKLVKPLSALLVVAMLGTVCLVAFHHHDHHDGGEDRCALCLARQILSTSHHAVATVEFAKPVLALAFRQFCKITLFISTVCLNTYYIHGPPLV
jgi:hypothetical protein